MTTEPYQAPHRDNPIENLIFFWGIGSGRAPAIRNTGWNIARDGWQQFVDQWIKPMIDLGVRRFQLHNPFGTDLGEPMEMDQAIEAEQRGLRGLLDDFVSAWRPITASGQVEVISYLGLFDVDMRRLQTGQYSKDDFLETFWKCFRLPLDAGMSLGWDALHYNGVGERDTWYLMYRLIQSLGVKCYIEPWPHRLRPHLWDCNHESTVQVWRNMVRDPNRWPSWAAPREVCTGEACVIMNSPDATQGHTWQNGDTWQPQWCREIMAQGMTPIVGLPYRRMVAEQETLEHYLQRGLEVDPPPVTLDSAPAVVIGRPKPVRLGVGPDTPATPKKTPPVTD